MRGIRSLAYWNLIGSCRLWHINAFTKFRSFFHFACAQRSSLLKNIYCVQGVNSVQGVNLYLYSQLCSDVTSCEVQDPGLETASWENMNCRIIARCNVYRLLRLLRIILYNFKRYHYSLEYALCWSIVPKSQRTPACEWVMSLRFTH